MRALLLKSLLLALALLTSAIGFAGQTYVTWSVEPPVAGVARLKATIKDGWHLYSLTPVKGEGPLPTTIDAIPPFKLAGPVKQPTPIKHLDPNFNVKVEYFEKEAIFEVPVPPGADVSKAALKIRYMVCNDSTCSPPTTVTVALNGATPAATPKAAAPAPNGDAFVNRVNDAKSQGLLAFVALSFGAGLLSLLTPCVFPMIPITVSFFAKRKATPSGGYRGALAYCFGIVGSFAGFGLLVSILFGASGIQRFATNPFVNVALAALFVVLALSLFGVYHLSLPSGLTNRFAKAEGKGGLLAPALMGLTFTLTSFTCTVPFVGTLLAGASQGDVLFPLVGMIAYGTAFALPFFVLALFPQALSRIPRSGSWLEVVKAFMGFVELAAALKFLSNADLVLRLGILPRPLFLGIWAVLSLVAGLFLLGVFKLPTIEMPAKRGLGRTIVGAASVAVAVWFASAVPGRSLGELEAFMPPSASGWIQEYDRGLQVARQTNKPLLLNFTGVTCTNCRSMERNIFTRPDVVKEFDKFVLVELYTDRETPGDEANRALQEKLTGVTTLPVYVSVTPTGQRLKVFQGSTRDPQEFVNFLQLGTLRAQR